MHFRLLKSVVEIEANESMRNKEGIGCKSLRTIQFGDQGGWNALGILHYVLGHGGG